MDENRLVKNMFESKLINVRSVGRPSQEIDRWCENNSETRKCEWVASRGDNVRQMCIEGFCEEEYLGLLAQHFAVNLSITSYLPPFIKFF